MERSKVLPLRSLLGEDDLTFGSEDGDDRTRTMGKTQRPEEQVEERIVRSVVIDDDLSLSSGDDEGDECTITAEKSSSWTSSDQHQITRLEVPSLRSLLGEDDYTFGSKDGDDRTRTMEKTQRPEVEERIIRSVVIDDDLSLSSEDDEGDECTIMAEIQMPEVAAEERIVRSVVIDDDMSLSCDDGEDEDDGSTTKVTRSRPTDPVELAVQVPTVRSVFGDDDLSSSSDDEEEEEQQRHKENEQQCQPTPRPPEQGTDENIGSDRSTKFVENRQNGKLTDFDDMPGLHDWWTL